MNRYTADSTDTRRMAMRRRFRKLTCFTIGLLVLVAPAFTFAKGGDVKWQYRDAERGKQEISASIADSASNVIAVGYTGYRNAASTDEDYWVTKFRADGSGIAWHATYDRLGGSDRAVAVAVDANNDVIVTGYAWNGTNNDIHTIKYSGATGSVIWADTFSGGGNDIATSIVVDKVNNDIYVGGYRQNAAGNDDYLIIKYDNPGSGPANAPLQVVSYDGAASGPDRLMSIAAGIDGVAVTGQSWNGLTFDCLTLKYDFAGTRLREWRYQAARGVTGNYVAMDAQGNVLIAATVEGDIDRDAYFAKYAAATGMTTWQTTYNGVFDDVPTGIYVDGVGDLYVTGYTWTAEGDHDILTMRFNGTTVNPNGHLIWKKTFNSALENSDIASPTGIVVDEALYGDVFVTGYSIANGVSDFQTVKYKKENGNILWSRSFNGAENRSDRPAAIMLTADQGVSVIGWSDNTKILAQGSDANPLTPLDGGEAAATGGTAVTVVNGVKAWVANQWAGYIVRMTSGANSGAQRYVASNTGTTLTVGVPFASPVAVGDTYIITGSKSSLTDTTKNWSPGEWAGFHVRMTAGANAGAVRRIAGNTATTLTVDMDFGSVAAVGDEYQLFDKEDYDTYLIKYDRGRINRPTDLAADAVAKAANGTYTIRVTWTDNSANEEGFRVERRLGENGAWEPAATLPPGTTEYLDAGLAEGNYYYYRVWAFNAATITDPDYSNEDHALAVLVSFNQPAWSHLFNSEYNLEDYATAIATGPDDHPVVTGKSDSDLVGMYDYYTIKLNRATSAETWNSRYDSMQNEMDIANCLSIDNANNVYVSGYSSLYFEPVESNINSVYTMKYPAAGPPAAWGAQYNGPGGIDDRSVAVTSTTDGSSIVVAGYGKNAAGNEDIYLIRYAANPSLNQFGNALPLWAAAPFDGGGDDFPTAVAIAPDGNVFVSGYRHNGGDFDLFLAKYNGASGVLIWSDSYHGGSGDDRGLSLALDALGDAYVAGFVTNSQGNRDYVVAKYTGSYDHASREWIHTFDGPAHGDDAVASVRIDPVDGYVVVAGTSLTAPGDNDLHLMRFTPSGAYVWQRTLQRPLTDDVCTSMAIDNSGNIFAAGTTGDGSTTDALAVKYSFDGTIIDAARYDGAAHSFDETSAVAVNTLGEAFFAGYTINGSGNADYLVYRMAAEQLPAPYPFAQQPLYTTVALSWADKSSVEEGFVIKRRTGICIADDSDASWTTIANLGANATSFTDTGVIPDTLYCYRINSFKGSVPSRAVKREVTTLIPPAPANFTAMPVDTTTIGLSWTDTTTGETQFRIERCTGASCADFTLLATVPANGTSYTDSTVCSTTAYRYRIAAVGTNWSSGYAVTSALSPTPVSPVALSATRVSEAEIRLQWTDVSSDETGFRIERCTGAGCETFATVDTVAANLTAYNDRFGLDAETVYRYRVRTVKTAACSGESAPSAVAEASTTLPAPAGLATAAANTTQVNLSWTDTTASETGFVIERCSGAGCDFGTLDTGFPVQVNYNVTGWMDTSVCNSVTYAYRVKAIDRGLPLGGSGTWTKRAPLAISNFQPDFQTRVVVPYAAGMKLDFADIRFFDTRGNIQLPFWLESKVDGVSATFWVKTRSTDTVYLYYGNPSATSAARGVDTFEFFDDFTGSVIDPAKWTVANGGTYSQNNEFISSGGTKAWDSGMYSVRSFARPFVFEVDQYATGGSDLMLGAKDTTTGTSYVDYVHAGYLTNSSNQVYVYEDGSSRGYKSLTIPFNAWRTFRFDVLATGASYSQGAGSSSITKYYDSTYSSESPLRIGFANNNLAFKWDNARVRKYAAAVPVAAIGAEQAAPAFTGAWDSGYSGVSTVTLPTPGAPSVLAANRVTEAEIRLTWQRNSTDESGFHIDRCTGSGCDFSSKVTFTTAAGIAEYRDVDVTHGTTYTYRVSAFKNAACGWETGMSSTASAATTLLPPAAPAANASVGNDCNELRFMDDNATSLNYYVESGCNTAATRIWLRVPSIPAGSKPVFLYTANPPATGVSNASGVFDFYEDFGGTVINGGRWNEVDTAANFLTQNNSLIASGGVGSWGSVGLYSVPSFPRPFIMEASHYRTGGNYLMLGLKDTSVNFGLSYFPYLSYPIYDGGGNRLQVYEGGSSRGDNLRTVQSDTWQYYRIDALPNSGAKYYHGNSLLSLTPFFESTYSSASPLKLGFINYNQAFKVNMVRVRKYANPEPVATLTDEQYGSYLLAEGSWYARRPITITNAGPAQSDYQVAVTVDTTSSAADRIVLGWTDTAGTETGYVIERCAGTGCSFASPAPSTFLAAANATGYTDWAVTNGSTYCYRVKAVRDGVWTAPWTDAVCATTQPAVAPTNLVATPSETKIDLTWTDTTVGENGFRVERCTGASCDFSTLDPGFPVTVAVNSTSYTDTAVCSNAYRYRIQPFKVGPGGWTALYSNIADAVTRLPAAPSALAATRVSETQINLSWTDNTGDETGFTVERCEGAGCTDFTPIATVAADVKAYASIGLKPDTTYRYQVKAFRTAGCGWESPYSNRSEATTTVVVPPAPTLTPANTTQVNVSWTDSTIVETSFAVQRCTGSSCDFSALDPGFPVALPAGSTAWTDLSVCSGVAYRYRVGVRNDGLTQNGGGGWTRRKPVTFTNFKADFITRLVLPYDPDMKVDFSDIRFYDQGAYRELPYWIESKVDGVSATVWIKTALTETVHLYYGNAAATATGSMASVFGAGVTGFWPINEVNGTVSGNSSDLSGQGNNVALTGFIGPYGVISAGRYGNGISLDGIDDFLKKDVVTLPTGSVATIEAWIYPKNYGDASYNGIVSYGNRSSRDSLLLSIQNTGRPSMATWGNDFVPSSGAVATLNAWNHIAVTVSGTAVVLYMNGQAIPGTLPYTPTFASKNLSIGATDYPGRMFNGYIDEVRIYSRALSAAEIASRYAAALPAVQLGVEEESPAFVFAAAYGDRFSPAAGTSTPAYKTPASLSATRVSDVQVNLSWSDSNSDETGFSIERCEGTGCTSFEEIDTVGPNIFSYQDTNKTANLKPNTLYRYRIRAYKTASCGWQSNYNATVAQATTSVTAPGSLAASAANTTTVNLTWTDQSVSETGFALERCTGATCDFSVKDTFLIGPNITSWTDSSVCKSTTYRYRIKGAKRGLSLDGNAVWTRRAPLSITDFQQNFQTKLTVPYAEGMRPDFADIRFFDATASAELPYWIESKTDGGVATVWIKTGKNNNIWLYYGNQEAGSAANGATVFDFFDDFTGSAIDTTRWTITDGTGFTVSNGFLHGTNTTGRITSKTTFTSGVVQEVKAKATSIAPNGQMMAGFYSASYNNLGILDHPGTAYHSNNATWTSYGIEIPASNMLYTLAVKDSSTVNLKVYNLDVPTTFWNAGDIANGVSGEYVALGRRYDSDGYNGQTYAADWDWVRIRKYAAVEPVVSVGTEEQSAGFTFAILWESAYSSIVSATTPTPGIPGGFGATAVTDTRINLAWTDNTIDEDGFSIEQCAGATCSTDADFSPIAFTGPNTTTYAVEGLIPSSRYCYRARAVKAASCGWETAYTSVSCDVTFSAHPIDLRAAPDGSFKVRLNWSDVSSDEDGFEIQAKVWNGEWVRVAAVGSNITTYTVRFGIDPLNTYVYRVRAFRGGDNSPFSNEATATTPGYGATDSTCK